MLGEEKKALVLLLQYRVCRLYAMTNVSSRTLSEMTTVPVSSVKRAINILDTEFDNCLKLLPRSQELAVKLRLITQVEEIGIDKLSQLKMKLQEKRKNKKNGSYVDIEESIDDNMARYISETINLQKYNDERISLPANVSSEIQRMLDEGSTFAEVGECFGISKSTVSYNNCKARKK